MEGQSALDAIAQQCAICEASCGSCRPPIGTPSNSNPLVKIDSDGTVWIGGVKYQPASPPEPEKVSIAEVDVKDTMTAADKGEYAEWASSNCDLNWNKDGFIDTATFLLANTNKSLANHDEPPLYLDSGVSTHISCIRSDFSEFRPIEPWTIMGVGNSSVAATGWELLKSPFMKCLHFSPYAMFFMLKKLVCILSPLVGWMTLAIS